MTSPAQIAATCQTCRFAHINWRKGDRFETWVGDVWKGQVEEHERPTTSVQCRRHAPSKAIRENECDGWPWAEGTDWCGEHQPKEQTDETV